MLRIAYLIDCLRPPIGGTERHLFTAVRLMDPQRFATAVFTLQHDPWMDSLDLPCPLRALEFRSLFGPDLVTRGYPFISYCRKNRIDVVQTFFRDSNIVGTLWARAARVPVVIASRRNIGTGYWHSRRELWMLKRLAGITDHFIANSAAAARETSEREGVPPHKITVLPNCLDPDQFRGVGESMRRDIRKRWGFPPDATVIGSVSNLRRIKNPGMLVEAAARLCPEFPQLRFVTLGEGEMRHELEDLIRTNGLEGRFALPGTSLQAHQDMQAFDIAVLTSWGESSPNALLEYMASGKASIASDVGGNGELVEADRTGILIDPSDVDTLVAAITRLVQHPDLRERMGATARQVAENRHSCKVVMPDLERIYESVMRSKARR